MNVTKLTAQQLRRAASIKEQIDALNKELRHILNRSTPNASTKKRTMSAAVKKKIAVTQKGRWARLRRTKPATRSAKLAAKSVKKMGPATRAKLSAKLKAYWAAKKKAAKK